MTIIVACPAPRAIVPGKRSYHRRAERLALTESVADTLRTSGRITAADVDALAARAERSPRQARRMLEEWLAASAGEAPVPPSKLSEAFLTRLAEHHGIVAAALRDEYGPEEATHLRASVYRWLAEIDLGLRVALRDGPQAFGRYLEVGVFEPAHRNQLWQIDEMHVPGRFRGARNRVVEDLWLTSILDTYSRLVLAAQLTLGEADEAVTTALLARAVVGGTWEGVDYGGSAEALGADNAAVYKSEGFRRALTRAGIDPHYARPYTPQDKGFIERYHRTLQEKWLSSVPGYTKGPQTFAYEPTGELDARGRPKRRRITVHALMPRDPAHLLSVEEATDVMYTAIWEYNTQHVHSVTGTTAIRRYGADPTPLRRPGIAAFWDLALPLRSTYIGEARGVHLDGEYRSGVTPLAGRHLTARVLPGLDPRYLIGDQSGNFLEEVTRTADQNEDQRQAQLGRNRVRSARVDHFMRAGAEALEARAAQPGTPVYVSPKRATQLAEQTTPSLADVQAALAVPEPEAAA